MTILELDTWDEEDVKRNTIWYTMLDSCLVYVRTCSVCNRQKKPQKKRNVYHMRYHAGSPLEKIDIDTIGPLIETTRGNQYVLVVVGQFSKYVECYALSDQTAERVTRTLYSKVARGLGTVCMAIRTTVNRQTCFTIC